LAAFFQLAESNERSPVEESVVRKGSKAAFGFGGVVVPTSPSESTTPRPRAPLES
jgi:hypothetical protein